MEQKKTLKADIEQRRTTSFLLGLIFVLALLYVSLEWNSAESKDDIAAIELNDMMHETELIPMTNIETVTQMQERKQVEKAEQLRVVDDEVELQEPNEALEGEGEDDETLLKELEEQQEEKPLAALEVDPDNPLNFHIAEDLPQFPGGAVEFMKWLTRNLRYPMRAKVSQTQGKVVAVFYVEKDGTISGLRVTKSLTPDCDREVLRVLRLMPNWKPGIQNDKPCRTKVSIPVVFKL